MEQESNFLGIDWGERKVGVALAHQETKVAVAYDIFQNDETLTETLKKLVAEEEIGTVVIGIPRYGKETEHPVKKFGETIKQVLGVEVAYVDEMFTSKLAQESLKVLGGKKVGAGDDAEAAKILLQAWIDQGKG